MPRLFAILLPILTLVWSHNSRAASLNENISVVLILAGDISGHIDISGPLNQILKSEDPASKPVCSVSALFRKVKSKEKLALEIWPAFECNIEGHKKTFKMHRSYLDPEKEQQKITVKYLDYKIKNVDMEFRDLSLQRGK
jgi:hypothetical protein